MGLTKVLSKQQMEVNKEEFIYLLRSTKRQGIEKLIEYLEGTDFYRAPASAKYHSNYPGGLVEHCLNVYKILKEKVKFYNLNVPEDSIIISSLLHDLCKINNYKTSVRNFKNEETNCWESKSIYSYKEDTLPLGHGEKSVIMLQNFIRLTKIEMLSIRWHMGSYDLGYAENVCLSNSFKLDKFICLLHTADLESSYVLETICEDNKISY